MLTFFTTAKPFLGHDGIIQRNALKSWKLLHPDVEVILFGDDEGAAEASVELGLRHEPHVKRHESGGKQIDYIFARANELARHDYLCYSNCDIVLMSDFMAAFEKARRWRERFLAVGRRCDTDVTEPIDFTASDWQDRLSRFASTKGFTQDEFWIDFFLFHRPMYAEMPPLVVGHCYWDNWMIWRALKDSVPVLDFTWSVLVVHQNHGYNPKFGRKKGFAGDPISQRNLKVIGGSGHCRTIANCTHSLRPNGMIRPRLSRRSWPLHRQLRMAQRFLTYEVWLPVWHFLLGVTRPLRNALGLRGKTARRSRRKD